MRLFLVRHGETVDNVAQLYAGSRNSELTNHGVLQATRLGQYLASNGVAVTHIFASPLKRATRTAQLIQAAQEPPAADILSFTQVPQLVEQDFGSLEGVSWTKPPQIPVGPDFVPTETKEAVAARSDVFLDEHLLPLLHNEPASLPSTVAVVSHGITISILWQRLLKRFAPGRVAYTPELGVDRPLEWFGGWSNTGYLEVEIHNGGHPSVPTAQETGPAEGVSGALPSASATASAPVSVDGSNAIDTAPLTSNLASWVCTIKAVNSTEHLKNLKRTRGGIGSAKHDESQKSIDSFFKKA